MTPVTARPPVEVDRWKAAALRGRCSGWDRFYPLRTWNGTGAAGRRRCQRVSPPRPPAVVQLIGRPNDESTLFSLAAQIEASGRGDSRPEVV